MCVPYIIDSSWVVGSSCNLVFNFYILSLNKVVAAIALLGRLYVKECFLFVWLYG